MRYWLLVLTLLLPGVASATAYKCMDDRGGTVYSTTPCEDSPGLVAYAGGTGTDGELVLHPDANHSYRMPGTINGSPVTLVFDTAAPHTTISEGAAAAAGIQRCGAARHCSVSVHEISFGSFEMDNVAVSITPDMEAEVRLGKDVLKRVKLQQADGALHISRR